MAYVSMCGGVRHLEESDEWGRGSAGDGGAVEQVPALQRVAHARHLHDAAAQAQAVHLTDTERMGGGKRRLSSELSPREKGFQVRRVSDAVMRGGCGVCTSCTVIWFCVSVPVLSTHTTVVHPSA